MLLVYDDLNEVVDLLLQYFDTYLLSLNNIDEGNYDTNIPSISIQFIPLDDDNIVTINHEKYIFAASGRLISGDYVIEGYIKAKWIRKSPIIVYPVYYLGRYIHKFFFTKKEVRAYVSETCEVDWRM